MLAATETATGPGLLADVQDCVTRPGYPMPLWTKLVPISLTTSLGPGPNSTSALASGSSRQAAICLSSVFLLCCRTGHKVRRPLCCWGAHGTRSLTEVHVQHDEICNKVCTPTGATDLGDTVQPTHSPKEAPPAVAPRRPSPVDGTS